ncbi:MAG TPA: hypothetical protein VN643_08710 [Pyrinomonadaceae bacterium]|nr:hypothetical protein [Pyrinomonadaceae bacterium]
MTIVLQAASLQWSRSFNKLGVRQPTHGLNSWGERQAGSLSYYL